MSGGTSLTEHKSSIWLAIQLYISAVVMLIALFLSSVFLAFGPCYGGCDWGTYLYSGRFLVPFAITIIVQILSVIQWHRSRSLKKWYLLTIGFSGLVFVGAGLYYTIVDPGDAGIYVIFLVLGLLVSQPVTAFGRAT